jgi:hypothetical protein
MVGVWCWDWKDGRVVEKDLVIEVEVVLMYEIEEGSTEQQRLLKTFEAEDERVYSALDPLTVERYILAINRRAHLLPSYILTPFTIPRIYMLNPHESMSQLTQSGRLHRTWIG